MDAVGDRHDDFHDVFDNDYGHATTTNSPDQFYGLIQFSWIQSSGGFI